MSDESAININVLFGHAEMRSWFEMEMTPKGQTRLIGMGSCTKYDRDGRVTSHTVEPTGCVAFWDDDK